jgi:hypothetical protein
MRLLLLKKISELPYHPVIPLLGIYSKEHKSGYYRDVYCCTVKNNQAMETTQMPYN